MIRDIELELPKLEWVILGLLSMAPQTRYSITGSINRTVNRWNNRTGSVRTALRHLERCGLVSADIPITHDAHLSKIYRLTATGEQQVIEWLRAPLSGGQILEDDDLMLIKFLFAENHLSRPEILQWLEHCEAELDTYALSHGVWHNMQMQIHSAHAQVFLEAKRIALDGLRQWVQYARQRLQAEPPTDDPTAPRDNTYGNTRKARL